MSKLKPGDRIRVQGFARDEKGTVTRIDHKGTPWYVADGRSKARPINSTRDKVSDE